MALVGTPHLVPIMNDHDGLPAHNFKFGAHPEAAVIGGDVYKHIFDKGFEGCWRGCAVACAHGLKDVSPFTSSYKGSKIFVDGPEYETVAGCGSNLGIFDAQPPWKSTPTATSTTWTPSPWAPPSALPWSALKTTRSPWNMPAAWI